MVRVSLEGFHITCYLILILDSNNRNWDPLHAKQIVYHRTTVCVCEVDYV